MEVIHLVLGKANPARMNGVNKVVYEMISRQVATGLQVELWGISSSTSHNYPERNFTTRLFQSAGNPFFFHPELKDSISRKKGKAVFHVHGGFVPQFYRACRWMAQNGIPFVFTPHGAYNEMAMQRNRSIKSIYRILFEKPMLRAAHTIHCLGASEEQGLRSFYPGSEAAIIPYGMEVTEQEAGTVYQARQPFIIGYCGRLDAHTKGLDLLLDAFEKFSWTQPNAELWIIGDGKDRKALEEMALRLEIAAEVKFFGSRFGAEKEELMKKFTVFAHPSRNEGLPNAVLEAAAMGIPVIISEACNMGANVRRYEAGIVMKQMDATELSIAMEQLQGRILRGALQDMHTAARKMLLEGYNWTQQLEKLEKIYRQAWTSN